MWLTELNISVNLSSLILKILGSLSNIFFVNLVTVPLLDQPLQLSGTRERKKVQRFTEEFKSEPKDAVVIEIPEGKGTALGDIPRIDAVVQVSIREGLVQ
jgi:Mrp family chromosome partitioning ATPase